MSAVALLLASNIFAGNLGAPIALPAAKVLPKGVRNLNVKGVSASGTDKYSSSGEVTVLSDPFFQPLSFEKIIAGTEDPSKQGEIEAAMLKVGASPSDSFGDVSGQVNLDAMVTVPVFAWGITEKFTQAIAVPVIKTSLNVDTAVDQNNQALYEKMLSELDLAPDKKAEFVEKLSSPVNSKANEYGYKDITDEDETKLGDIKLVSKYLAINNQLNAVVFGLEITLPTGREEDIDKVVDLPGGDGQTDIGLSLNYDLNINNFFTVSQLVSYTAQLQDTTAKRVPFYRESKLTPYKDNNVKRDLGDISMYQVALKSAYEGFSFGLGYSLQYKDQDKYEGSVYQASWYENISKDSVQRMQSVTATLGYDTISLFKKKAFPVPLALSITHSTTVEGKNVVKDPLTVLDLAVFF